MSSGLTLDAGALIAFERNDRTVVGIVAHAWRHNVRLAAPAGVVGQVWRDGSRQVRLARLLGSGLVDVVPLDDAGARCRAAFGRRGHSRCDRRLGGLVRPGTRPRRADLGRRRPCAAGFVPALCASLKRGSGTGAGMRKLDRSLYDRCITRGMVGVADAGDLQRRQSDRAVTGLRGHYQRDDSRGARRAARRPSAARRRVQAVGRRLARSLGCDTLVVETTNFTDRTNVGQARHSDQLKITERYTRTAADKLVLKLTVEDPGTWTAPWTLELPLQRDDTYGMFEYACHEGNLAMFNILSGHRADERAAAASQ